ncbi:MAG: hypothetical protein WBL02_07425 [Methanomethylovorans sp.]|uniref:hypothetical protein n=1 Tax=Methanomethylovorans sp. TaxID=2758717 RepID=UPI003C7417A7
MTRHKIIRLNLQSQASDLKAAGKSLREISRILSEESGKSISYPSVMRYFEAVDRARVEVVEKSDKLKSRLVEAEIDTINEAMQCIEDLRGICQEAKAAGDLRVAILAIDSIYKGLDMLNKMLGKYQSTTNQFNYAEVNIDSARDRIMGKLQMMDCSKKGD